MAHVDPWRRVADLSDDELRTLAHAIRPEIRASARRGGRAGTFVYDRAGLPCRVCATPVLARGQGDDNRTTYWCSTCQG